MNHKILFSLIIIFTFSCAHPIATLKNPITTQSVNPQFKQPLPSINLKFECKYSDRPCPYAISEAYYGQIIDAFEFFGWSEFNNLAVTSRDAITVLVVINSKDKFAPNYLNIIHGLTLGLIPTWQDHYYNIDMKILSTQSRNSFGYTRHNEARLHYHALFDFLFPLFQPEYETIEADIGAKMKVLIAEAASQGRW
ncbi:hypothetical protein [Leptospira wolffii]|uniref:hypothetical protein n=1 Tax=Leptospira wolffii TaxID=409998 RepID=UPI0012EB812A|nr:hypothetical protein [Leptospira wolffii]